jgi:hypothetical protein
VLIQSGYLFGHQESRIEQTQCYFEILFSYIFMGHIGPLCFVVFCHAGVDNIGGEWEDDFFALSGL